MDYRGHLESDGSYYSYSDEWSFVDGLHQASAILNRNRSTIIGYTKNPSFPAWRFEYGWCFNILASQDWILLNTNTAKGMIRYWSALVTPTLIVLDVDAPFHGRGKYRVYSEDL